MEDLLNLLSFLYKQYESLTLEWEKSNIENLNLYNGEVNVCYIHNDLDVINYIYKYREFVNGFEPLENDLQTLNIQIGAVTKRVKNRNSILIKLHRYMSEHHKNGHVPLKKCLNDILGFRIIFNKDYTFEELNEIITANFQNIKIIESKKGDYKAVHAYFKTGDNKRFQWELQMWNKSDEQRNLTSHHKDKQDYVSWEYERGKED